MTLPSHGAYDLNGKPIPAAFRRTPIPRGASLRIRAKRTGTPTSFTVEAPDGTDLLTFSVTDGKLHADYDETRLSEAARRLLVEVRQLLGLSAASPHIRVATSDSRNPEAGATDP